MPELKIGCSGFNYGGWKGNFYPPDLPQKKWLGFYCKIFNTVELNVTFTGSLSPAPSANGITKHPLTLSSSRFKGTATVNKERFARNRQITC